QGALETQTPLGGGLHEVFGWACDPDHTALPVTVELFDNGLSTGIFSVAGESRPDDPGGAACGTSVGFSPNLQLVTEGGHTITARAANADPGQPPAWLAGSLCIGVCGTRVCGTDGCTGSCGTCPSGCDHDGDGTYSRTPGTCTAGQCAAAQPCATGYACNGPLSKADGDFCATACQDDDDDYCADGYTCEGTVCTSKAGVGEPCDENGDCISLSCRKEIDSSDYYCTDPGKECSEAGAAGYDTGDHTGAWLCTGPNTSKECKFNTVCDTWVGHFCTATDVWGEGSGEGHVCSTGPFCSNDTRHVGRTCNGGSGNAGACTKNGPKGFGCDSETALGEEHCEGNSWTSVGATSCCEDDGDGHGIASDPCTGKSTACVASRTCLDGADLCGMQPQGTLCGGTGYCLATDPDWCAPGKSNGSACAFDYECASKNCDPDLAGVKRCHATATSCVQGATGAETPSGGSLCINTSQWRPCSDATWGVAVACTGCSACSGGACVDVDANCVQSPWDGCASTCVKTRSNSGVCTAGVCGTASGYVAAGKVCSGGAEVAPSGSGYCDAQATCVTGTCAATISLRGCSGTGVACSAAALVPGGAWNAPSGEVISETVTRVASSPAALSCASSVTAYCDGTDHCAGDDRWDGFTCNGQGACTVDKGDVGCCAHSDCAASQYCDTDFQCKVLSLCGERKPSALGQQPQAAGADARDECAESGWDGCASTCVRTRSNSGTCKGSTYACGTVATFLSEAGKVCSAGAEVAPTAANRCDTWIGCATGACGAPLYHRGCAAGAATCSSTGQVAAGSWSAPYGQTVTDASGKAGSSCATAASLCDGTDHCLGDDRYSGWVCDGSGACSAPSGDIGCCGHTDCGGTQYCRGADYQCQALSTCGKRTAGAFGQEHQAATEDLRGECAQAGCASGLCLGTDYACNPGGKIEPPEAVTGGIRYCPGSVTLQASGSSGAFAWYASPTGGSPLASGPVFETPPILETTTYWVEAVEAYPFPAHVLVFDENCLSDWPTPYRDAMDNLAWNYTRAVDEIDFVNRLTDGTVWDIVVFDRYYYITQNSVYDRLYAYLAGGGKLIFSNWKFTSHALFSAMDVSYNSTFYSGKTIYAWNAAHPLYNLPNTVPTSIASTQDTCNVDGFYSYVIGGGVAVSGFQATPQAGRAAVVVNSEGASIYMGEMPYLFNEAVLGDFLENQLMYLATDGWTGPGSGGICASGRIPVIAEIGSLAAPSTGDVTTTCGGTATFTASGSTGKYQWWDAASGGTRVATGSSHTTPPIFTTTHRWVEAVDSYATSARILVADLVYSNLGYPCAAPWMTPYKDTLADMGLAFTSVTTNQTDFRTRLQSQAWDLVIYDDYTQTPAAATLDLLKAHLDGGGRLIFASPFTGTHALYAAMNVGFNGAFTQPKDLYAWEPSHDLYTVPNVVPSPVEWAWNVCSQDGVRLVNNGGVAVAGFTAVAADGQAAVVLGAGGRSIVMGQVPYTFNQASLEGFLENQIAYMVGLGDGCISSRVQATATVPGGCVAGCTHSIRLYDSYGDGWDTASVDVAVNGVTVLTGLTFATGYGPATFTFTAAAGSAVAVTYHPGQWPGENYYRVYDGGGNIIALATASSTTGTGACP
ncbi:MAG: hypothetical protein FJ098_00205, partial [Deltaproteobacteria bacterium]|nr:hypothetical protein [Deltaproteobacteria bacterium]